ncbi:MAG TPA: mannitol dehydrogenase family protein [Pilimelia sp.]|nr:mannitol dehydrogenase family protein [Pilimelia sp.]
MAVTAGRPAADRQPGDATGRLGADVARRLPIESRPLVDPGAVPAGIVHLGLGAFHRAHQAVYTEEAVAAGGGDWGIIGVAPRSADVVNQLRAQDNLFSVTSLAASEAATRVIGILAGVRRAADDPDAIVALLADPAIRVVTLTVTEKAHQLDPATGRLRPDDALVADLTTDRAPGTVPGLLVRGLIARAATGAGPIALVSCDNLPSNGARLRGMVTEALAYPGARVPGVAADWVAANVSFPATMVDRIVPASTPETLAAAQRALGAADLAAVAAEPYRQWVIEDDFPGGRPAWERAGAVLAGDVGAWERLKLRSLNGVHSALAYLGALAGCATIAEALALPGMRPLLARLIAEDIAPSLAAPDGVSAVGYGDQVLDRFANPAICHRTLQVAMDGSQKLPQRVLHTIVDRRAAGATPRWAALVVAAWMRFARGKADDGTALPLDDPLADEIVSALGDAPDTPAGLAEALFGLTAVVPPEVAGDEVVRDLVRGWLAELDRHGVREMVAAA